MPPPEPFAKPLFYRKDDGTFAFPIYSEPVLRHLAKSELPNPPGVTGQREYGLGLLILMALFGRDWTEREVFTEPSDRHLGRHVGTESGALLTMSRVVNLAEMVVNMLRLPGAQAPIAQIANGMVESGYAELEVGKMLSGLGIAFEFRTTRGVAGEDYDLTIWTRQGNAICADTKCKLEGNALSESGIRNSLDTARKQLPSNKPGMIFVHVSRDCFESESDIDKIISACKAFLRGTKRIVAINVITSFPNSEFPMAEATIGIEIRNENHRFENSEDWFVVGSSTQTRRAPRDWIFLSECVVDRPNQITLTGQLNRVPAQNPPDETGNR